MVLPVFDLETKIKILDLEGAVSAPPIQPCLKAAGSMRMA